MESYDINAFYSSLLTRFMSDLENSHIYTGPFIKWERVKKRVVRFPLLRQDKERTVYHSEVHHQDHSLAVNLWITLKIHFLSTLRFIQFWEQDKTLWIV